MRKSTTLLLVFTLLHFSSANGQSQPDDPNPYIRVDAVIKKIPDSCVATVKGITGYINRNFITDADKIRAAFAWVTYNVSYDIDNMFAFNFFEDRRIK